MTLHLTNLSGDAELDGQIVHPARPVKGSAYRNTFKRLLDTLVILAAAPVVLPVVLIIAMLIALDGRSPFYAQQRIGRDGRVFRMWKLRTMVPDAHQMLEEYLLSNAEARIEWNTTQKLKKDPRITRIGALLRKTSVDELPQLWNVLWGDMSLVGPRPMMVEQRDLYDGKGYFRVRPGITGLWQVSDRNDCHFADRVHYDDRYAAELSFMTDLRIMLRTVGVMLRGTGY
ncbi:sugar transferase [uncultured Roseobacter sp.]|uniref:sugar transferase n=1 Tax=uncultured Roseobacter sp. TaxID=114847 RepID=UPI002613C3FC|nr:sugar transferase [uncultured Roseobacter sp.]